MTQDGGANAGQLHPARSETRHDGAEGRTPRLPTVTTDVLLLLTALRRQLVDMARRAGLEGWLVFTLVGWALSQFRRWLPYLNPFPSIARLFYFESLHPPEDASFTWLTSHWIRCPRFQDRRSFITRTAVREEHVHESDILTVTTPDELEARQRLQPSCEPLRLGETMYEWFRGTLISMRYGSVDHQNAEGIRPVDVEVVRCYTQHRGTLFLYLDQLKEEYERLRPAKISMRILDPHVQGFWESLPKRQKRRWSDIIISEDKKTQLKSSIGEFLSSQKWYGDRGLAWKTGIMLHGPPGCGKTSTIVGLASEFDLRVYILPLTSSVATDTLVASAVRILPPRAIILLEDIDAWAEQQAPRRLDEDEDDAESEVVNDRRGSQGDRGHRRNSAGHPERAVTGNSGAFGTKASETPASATEEVPAALSELVMAATDAENAPARAISEGPGRDTPGEQYDDSQGDRRRYLEPDGGERRDRDRDRDRSMRDSAVSLSCVLNILDGVEAIDGKIIICTTNALHSLDPALIRAGRIDLFLEFRRATRLVAEQLFRSFYQPSRAGVGGDSAGALKEGNHAFSALEKEEDQGGVAPDLTRQAQAWASFIDEEEFSLAELQGMLLNYKKSPLAAVEKMGEWVAKERRARTLGSERRYRGDGTNSIRRG